MSIIVNGNVIIERDLTDRIPNSLLQFLDGTLIVNARLFKKIYDGYGFSISHRFENVASGDSVEIYFENPANSGRVVFIISIEITTFAQAWADVYRNNSVTSSGTTTTPVNLNFGSNIASVVSVEYGGTYSLGDNVHNTVVPGGSRIRAIGSQSEVGEVVIIPEGKNFIVRVTNKSGSSSDISVRIIWWEEVAS